MTNASLTRRSFLWQASAVGLGALTHAAPPAATRRPKVAAIFTVLRFRSHAFNILENLLGPYLFQGELHTPRTEVVSLYADQFPDDDMARDVSRRFGIPLFKTIDEALCLGGRSLAVDAVAAIGEHGEYPRNEQGQVLYPRKRFFDEAWAVMRRSGKYVPYFNDKHLSYRWDWAKEMYDASRRDGFPMMAGSSVPLAERRPPVELPAGARIEEVVAIHGGGFESYDFHGLELLQAIVEARAEGESGIAEIEFLDGPRYERARGKRWSQSLVEAALTAERDLNVVRQPRPSTGVFAPPAAPPATAGNAAVRLPSSPYAICVTYRDGTRGTVLSLGGGSDRWLFGCQLAGRPQPLASALFNGPWGNRCLFMALTHAIEHLFVTGQEPYPVERTLLTTGALAAAVESYHQQRPVATPHLAIAYRVGDTQPFCENGSSWKQLDVDRPQPMIIDRQRFS